MSKIKEMKIDEFSRRLRNWVETADSKFVFFLGAGCSVSSGIPDAGILVRSWLPRLKKLKTGSEDDYENWAKEFYTEYEDEKASSFYGRVIEHLFLTSEERQREIERITEGKDPAFGYAVLAQLITNEKFCPHCSVVLTVNFDDLVADALYLYTNKKPLVISHDSLAGFIKITRTRPLIIKLHGDARLEPKNTEQETRDLAKSVKNVLINLLNETGLIFIGYGGHDESIAEILHELPPNALPWGIYWIGSKIPEGKMGEWLENRGAFWVNHKDFDELMLLLWSEFNLTHPQKDRFDKLIETYFKTFKNLRERIETKPEEKPEPIKEALDQAMKNITSWWAVYLEAEKYKKENPEKADSIYQEGIKQFPDSAELLGNYAIFLKEIRKDYDKAEEYYRKALEKDPNNALNLGNYALFLEEIRRDYDKAEEYYRNALDKAPDNAANLGNYAIFLWKIRKENDKAEDYYRNALEKAPDYAELLGNYAIFLWEIRKEYDKAEEYYRKALEKAPDNAGHLGNYANFLWKIRKEYDKAEEYYRNALEKDPYNANHLGNYAGFLLSRGKEEGFKYLEKSLDLSRKDMSLKMPLVECLFYRYAHSRYENLKKESFKEIKSLLKEGVRSPRWDLSDNVKRAIEDGHPYPEFLEKLSKVISEEIDIKELDNFKLWIEDC